MNKKLNQIIGLDYETGGLSPLNNPITQIGLVSFSADTFEEIGSYKTFVKPYDPKLKYEPRALEYTGITMEMINSGVTLKEAVDKMFEEFDKANTARTHTKKPILLGHNILFDISFLQDISRRCNKDLSKFLHGSIDAYGNFQPAYYDTMWISRSMWAGDEAMTSHTLEKCILKAGLEIVDAHDALQDVKASKNLYEFLANKLRSNGGGSVAEKAEMFRFRKQFQF